MDCIVILCYPNPFYRNQSNFTTCSIIQNRTGSATNDAWIYSRRGELLKKESNTLSAGKQTLTWYGNDLNGERYFQWRLPIGAYGRHPMEQVRL